MNSYKISWWWIHMWQCSDISCLWIHIWIHVIEEYREIIPEIMCTKVPDGWPVDCWLWRVPEQDNDQQQVTLPHCEEASSRRVPGLQCRRRLPGFNIIDTLLPVPCCGVTVTAQCATWKVLLFWHVHVCSAILPSQDVVICSWLTQWNIFFGWLVCWTEHSFGSQRLITADW